MCNKRINFFTPALKDVAGDIMVRDPVCNMDVNPVKPGAEETFKGKTYYFCCNKCKTAFDKNRDKFTVGKP